MIYELIIKGYRMKSTLINTNTVFFHTKATRPRLISCMRIGYINNNFKLYKTCICMYLWYVRGK